MALFESGIPLFSRLGRCKRLSANQQVYFTISLYILPQILADMFLALSNVTLASRSHRSCLPCYVSKLRCDRDLPSCQSCVRRGQPDKCVYDDSQRRLRRLGKRRDLRSNDISTQSEELSNYDTETNQNHSDGVQLAIQHTDTGKPAVDTTSSTPERAEAKPKPKECHLDSTTHEGDNGHLPIVTHAILPDADWTKPYFEIYLPVMMSNSLTLKTLLTDYYVDYPSIACYAATVSL